jgi:hypothetical protein
MKRVKVQLKDLKPNPYKKDIRGGFIDEIVVEQIKESASKTSFWEQWVVREKDAFELAFGHHRLAAAIALYGPNYEVSVQVEPYTDEQMLVALADENAGNEESVEAQVDVIRVARKFLKEHPEACKRQPLHSVAAVQKHAHAQVCQHGSERCILAFLGEANWNERRVHNLVSIADRFDAERRYLREHPEDCKYKEDVIDNQSHPLLEFIFKGTTSRSIKVEQQKSSSMAYEKLSAQFFLRWAEKSIYMFFHTLNVFIKCRQ